jgi:hypothetical protein
MPAFHVNFVPETLGARVPWRKELTMETGKVNRPSESRLTRLACAEPPMETFDPSLKAMAAPKISSVYFVSTWSYLRISSPVLRDNPSKKLWLWKSELRW